MLLTTHTSDTSEHMISLRKRLVNIAILDVSVMVEVAFRENSFFDGEDSWQLLVLNLNSASTSFGKLG